MAAHRDHLWRYQNGNEHPAGWIFDGDGWDVCIACGAHDFTAEAARATPTSCPRNRPTAIQCTCASQVHATPGAPQQLHRRGRGGTKNGQEA
jgi:hypothetical protein